MGMGPLVEAGDTQYQAFHITTRTPSILKLHVWAPSFTGFGGGIAAFSRHMASGLSDLGHELRLFGKNDSSGSWSGHDLTGSKPFRGPTRTAGFAVSTLAAVFRSPPQHIISTHLNFGPLALLAKRLFGTRYTLVAHGIDVHPDLPERTLDAMRHADRVIAVSAWTRGRVIALEGIDPQKVSILPNAFDESRFTVGPRPERLLDAYDILPGEKVILTVGRLDQRERYKGYDRIIDALGEIQNRCGPVRFIVVGTGDDRDRVISLAREKGHEASVIFAGFVPPEDLADHYRLADAFAMPSTGEGFGIVFAEALACGTPVVAGNRDGSVDALDGGRLGKLVDPLSIRAIVDGVCDVLCGRGPALWYDRDALHNAVRLKFGRDAFAKRLTEALPI
jgi:glycosyltransferase involved in cell wall biosynthesis